MVLEAVRRSPFGHSWHTETQTSTTELEEPVALEDKQAVIVTSPKLSTLELINKSAIQKRLTSPLPVALAEGEFSTGWVDTLIAKTGMGFTATVTAPLKWENNLVCLFCINNDPDKDLPIRQLILAPLKIPRDKSGTPEKLESQAKFYLEFVDPNSTLYLPRNAWSLDLLEGELMAMVFTRSLRIGMSHGMFGQWKKCIEPYLPSLPQGIQKIYLEAEKEEKRRLKALQWERKENN